MESMLYGIKEGYTHRLNNQFFDDTSLRDEWQDEVYLAASLRAASISALHVVDVGCGSAFKLLKYFSKYDTVGYDMEPTVSWLQSTHPTRTWRNVDFSERTHIPCDILICADVIEHIPNPDELLAYLEHIDFRFLFLSTPERSVVYGKDHDGPPQNPAHCREWTMAELSDYLSQWFNIVEHSIANVQQGTQLAVCSKKNV